MSSASKKLIQASAGVGGGDFYPYTIENSLRFDGASYLTKTMGTGDSTTKFTISMWFKWSDISGTLNIPINFAGVGGGTTLGTYVRFNTGGAGTIEIARYNSSTIQFQIITNAHLIRDYASHYHLVIAFDTAQATSTDRIKLYLNNEQLTSFGTTNWPTISEATDFGAARATTLGCGLIIPSSYIQHYKGYVSEVVVIDNQALTPTSFGEDKNGVWVPKDLSGLTFGTNGFYLDFADSSNLGNDVSGNSNDYTSIGLTSSDQMIDTPTNNFCTGNPLTKLTSATPTYSDGNLAFSCNTVAQQAFGTIMIPNTGKWYFEVEVTTVAEMQLGTAKQDPTNPATLMNSYYRSNGSGNSVYVEGTIVTASAVTYTNSDVIGVYINNDDSEISFYKNNTLVGSSPYTTTDKDGYFPWVRQASGAGTCAGVFNFGANSFNYTPPTGALALCTANLPEPTLGPNSAENVTDNFLPILYTGNASARSIDVGFQPDFTWIKNRDAADSHTLFDAVRGATKYLSSNNTNAEATDANSLTAFDSIGFDLGTSSITNGNTEDYVAWNWKANGSGVSNTDGSITSTVSANQDAGFSVVTYTGNGTSNQTVGHGLGADVSMVIVKRYDSAPYTWRVWHKGLSGDTYYLGLNQTGAQSSSSTVFNGHSSTTFTVGNDPSVNGSSGTMVAYCFTEVEGFSKFGSYTGNGSADGPFAYCGFRPAFVMVKRTDTTGYWVVYDNERSVNNSTDLSLFPNVVDAETDSALNSIDLLSNGFKLRNSNTHKNASGGDYVFLAFAEMPFKYSNAR